MEHDYTNFLTLILTAILSFIATNLDDLLVLIVFFSQKSPTRRMYPIVIGQYLGFTMIILASLPGFLGGLIIADEWIGFLGLIPLIIGIKSLLDKEDDDSETTIQLTNPVVTNQSRWLSWIKGFRRYLNSTVVYVASVTVANGGDNISIYFSLFSQSRLFELTIILMIFYVLTGVWCVLASWLADYQMIAKVLVKYGHIITPFIFIFLGIFILVESGTFRLFIPN